MLDVDSYLQRIGYDGPRKPTAETLRALHVAHLLAVPFENLDIHLGRPIVLDRAALFDKIVRRRRGGFCYELNGLFAALLRALGYRVTLLSARVARQAGGFGPEFDHLALLVHLDGRWLVDVGFGDSFRVPLRLDMSAAQAEDGHAYCLSSDGAIGEGAELTLLRGIGTAWEPQYRFTLHPHLLDEFAGRCQYHQTAPESSFTQHRTCSRAAPDGRITLTDDRLIVTRGDERLESPVSGAAAYAAALREHFAIVL